MSIARDPVKTLPKETSLQIFSYLKKSELASCCQVSKAWRKLASDNELCAPIARQMLNGEIFNIPNIKSLLQVVESQKLKSNEEVIGRLQTFNRISLGQNARFRCLISTGSRYQTICIEFKETEDKIDETTNKLTCCDLKGSSPLSSQDNGEIESISLEEFNKKIRLFSSCKKNPEQIAAELFKNIPKCLKLTDLVNFIFNKCRPYEIIPFLDAILIAYPSFTLSPYDKIRKTIVEDEGHTLNNSSLIGLLKEHALETDEEKLTACYDLAYRLNNPYIYRLSRTPILPSDYSLNFLWVNLNPQNRVIDTAQNIFGDGLDPSENADCIKDPQALRSFEEHEESLKEEDLEAWRKIKKSFGYRISKWADVNPGAQINLWYDSALVTQKAQQRTFEMMRSISESRGVNLKLKDIRQLSNIGGEIGRSLHPGTQVYYRVDLLKALIADHMISSGESPKYCVVSDIDVQPMSPQQMLDQRTVDYLSSDGYVFNRVGLLDDFENSFFIFNKEKEGLHKIHNKIVIQQTAFNITELREYPINTILQPDYILDAQFVFRRYPQFREEIGEKRNRAPRKVVKCPKSQFNFGGYFSKSDHQAEEFRFIGDSNVPYTRNGRNFRNYGEGQIEELIKWKAAPLPLVE